MKEFLLRNLRLIKSGDLTVLKIALWFPVSVPLAFALLLLRRLVDIRFYDLHVVSMGVPMLIYERYLSQNPQIFYVFYYSNKKIANKYLLQKLKEELPLVVSRGYWFWRSCDWFSGKIGVLNASGDIFVDLDADPLGRIDQTPVHCKLSSKEIDDGVKFLEKVGVPRSSKIACLLVRDRAYFNEYKKGYDDSGNDHRCSSIENYVPAIKELVDNGYVVFRMGSLAERRLPFEHPRVIDYPFSNFRTEFLDIFLGFRCDFCVTTGSGWDAIPSHLFKKPMIFTNLVPLNILYSYSSRFILMTKRCFDENLNRELSLREIAALKFHNGFVVEQNADNRIRYIENTPEEIRGAVLEMIGRLNGTWTDSGEDEILQNRFWSQFPYNDISLSSKKRFHRVIRARYSAHFLRENPQWLD